MPAQVESMFYSGRNKPWHGLGVELPESPTAEDAIVAAGLDWNVEGKEIFDSAGNLIPNYYANTRDSDGSVLGVVSTRYKIVQNSEAFSFTDSLVDEGLRYSTAGSLRDGKCIWLLGELPKTQILDDDVEQYVCFTNTFDGSGAIQVCCTPIRVVCNNTLNLALKTAQRKWSTRHVGDMKSKLHEAQVTLGLINNYTSELQQEAERLVQVKVSDADIEGMIESIYPVTNEDSDVKRARQSKLKEDFFACLNAPDVTKYKGTAYSVAMAATDYADHSEPLRKTQNFQSNRWMSIMQGHPFVDGMYRQLAA